ncbi:GlxA family transcriptional regulator [Rhizobium sp. P32RR-XVIII]|uniref:GlxA family transcriptional regulator n=1 Tax=Rhizobium sp. P32RR-XVIII TaxID=2726738 RepID=UPI00145760CA|nr:GlxA family transcriptional regulator [Rhizobium sp. P32RR-XVIII]NLS06897.1 GlxA family transcriptional regulator [Rhizobium sp. P32RR-XVIII]
MRIAILAIPGVQMLDVAGPMDVFSEATTLLTGRSGYTVKIVALSMEPVTALNGTRFLPDLSIENTLEGFDTLLIAGSPSVRQYEDHRELVQWIIREARHVRRLASICTGAFLLGKAGLLDGRRATTHWNSTSRLASMFPTVRLEPNTIFVKDGPIYTSAGVTASMDLALALVEEDFGRSMALRVAKELILFLQRPGGQSQFSVHLEAQAAGIGPIRDITQWIVENIADDLSVETLAARLGMSSRNFARTFKRETHMTPGDYVEAARVEAARRILEESDTPLKRVASLCGFADQTGLRRAFMRRINVTPVEYRHRFRPPETAAIAEPPPRRRASLATA